MSRNWMWSILFILFVSVIISCNLTQSLETVEQVDLNRYTGKWYEIASLSATFQEGCTCTTAEHKEYIKV